MRFLNKRLLCALVLSLASVTALSANSYALRLSAIPDTVQFTSDVGVPSTYWILISDGRDTTSFPKTPLTHATAKLMGNGDFKLGSDSILSFFGATYVIVNYTASVSSPTWAMLTVKSDSSAITIMLYGTPPTYHRLWFGGVQDFDKLHAGVETCDSITLNNPNVFDVSIGDLWIVSKGSYCRLSNVPSKPFTLKAKSKVTFDACITGAVVQDTSDLGGTIRVFYNFTTGSDTAIYPIYGRLADTMLPVTCLFLRDTDIGAFPAGSSTNQVVGVFNITDSAIILDSIRIVSGDVNQFQIDTSMFPITIPSNTLGKFDVFFEVPAIPTKENYNVVIQDYSHSRNNDPSCNVLSFNISAEVQAPLGDSIFLDVPPGGASTIDISTNLTKSRRPIFVRNMGTVRVDPTSLQLTDTTQHAYFASGIYQVAMFDSIPAGTMGGEAAIMTLDVPDTGIYNVDMTLSYVTGLANRRQQITSQPSYKYRIIAHRLPGEVSSVARSASLLAADFTLNPNPARGEVTITLPSGISSTIEIYDVLGNPILSRHETGSFVWNGQSSFGGIASEGVYIIRVRETGASGEVSIASKRLMFLR